MPWRNTSCIRACLDSALQSTIGVSLAGDDLASKAPAAALPFALQQLTIHQPVASQGPMPKSAMPRAASPAIRCKNSILLYTMNERASLRCIGGYSSRVLGDAASQQDAVVSYIPDCNWLSAPNLQVLRWPNIMSIWQVNSPMPTAIT